MAAPQHRDLGTNCNPQTHLLLLTECSPRFGERIGLNLMLQPVWQQHILELRFCCSHWHSPADLSCAKFRTPQVHPRTRTSPSGALFSTLCPSHLQPSCRSHNHPHPISQAELDPSHYPSPYLPQGYLSPEQPQLSFPSLGFALFANSALNQASGCLPPVPRLFCFILGKMWMRKGLEGAGMVQGKATSWQVTGVNGSRGSLEDPCAVRG